MKKENITGQEILDLIREKRRIFHSKAHYPNAMLINPIYYSVLKDFLEIDDQNKKKEVLDLVIYETEDISSFILIHTYDHDKCSV